jgi:aryl-alcohol dehydrogenase-like predicted oxidoreductase
VLLFGGAALSDVSEAEADDAIRAALDAGINHFDTAAGYGDSELQLGRWMPRIRDRIFLATKTGDRTADDAYASIVRSLERLRVDSVDLIQLHAIGDPDDLDRATGTGGAVEGAARAREEGLARGIGITGHGMLAPATHLEALRRFPFDTVLTPYNYRLAQEADYLRDFDALAEETQTRAVALLIIKAVARNLWRRERRHRFATWYEPLDEQHHVDAAVAFALGRAEVAGICTAGDVRLLPMFVEAERRRSSITVSEAEDTMADVSELEPLFVRAPGREVPDWLEPLMHD